MPCIHITFYKKIKPLLEITSKLPLTIVARPVKWPLVAAKEAEYIAPPNEISILLAKRNNIERTTVFGYYIVESLYLENNF